MIDHGTKPADPSTLIKTIKFTGKFTFSLLSLIWLIVVAGMVAIAPIGQHAFIYAVLYCIGYILMIFLVRSFPPEIKPRKAFAGIIGYMWKRGLYLESGMI